MVKNILKTTLALLLLASPAAISAEPMIEIVELQDIEVDGITISVKDNVLRIFGANGQTVQVYNVAGVCIKNVRIEGDDVHYDINLPKGCYIVKVGKVVRKISIR